MQYYTTLDYFSRLYDKVGRQHGADLSSKEAYEAWKLDINRRLRDTVGLDLCEPAPANPRLLDIKEFETFTREHWLIQTEPLVEMPFFLLKPKKPHNGGLILNPHGHGGGKENNVADPENPWVQEMQKKFGEKPSFAQELAEHGRIYGYRFRPGIMSPVPMPGARENAGRNGSRGRSRKTGAPTPTGRSTRWPWASGCP